MALKMFNERKAILRSEYAADLTVAQAIDSGAHMEVLRKKNFEETLLFLGCLLRELLQYVLNDLNDSQIVAYAESMMYDCPDWKPDDFVLCFKNGKMGVYGNSQARFTYAGTWNTWKDHYNRERQRCLEDKYLQDKDQQTHSLSKIVGTERTCDTKTNQWDKIKIEILKDKINGR